MQEGHSDIGVLMDDVLGTVLAIAGTLKDNGGGGGGLSCAWSVCRAWRDCLRGPARPEHLARILLDAHGPISAMKRIVSCPSPEELHQPSYCCVLLRALLELEDGPMADCGDGAALVHAARLGRIDAVRLLLGWRERAPQADCQNGDALIQAAQGGHAGLVRLLLEQPEHAPKANCQLGWR